MKLETLISKTIAWHVARNLIEGSTDKQQFMKLHEEVGELCESIANETDVRDDIGDIMVVLVNIATRNGYTLADCLDVAYNDIKDRTGQMVNGVFVKDAA